ncbi:GNAT family N-acetyltransferase [Streptomyces sp. NPDC004267]|uniref:GNAT family N-acetyltransferase n=1 Tax=Streptomyces sp. NPDC004267 TaxID=3364694 RepID=UPI00368A16E4
MPISQTSLDKLPIRHLTSDDLLACADLSEDRGWDREEYKWGLLLAAGTGYGIDDPDGKGLLTACVVTSYGPGLAAIGMVLVAERYARQGVGRRLMQHVLAEYDGTPLTLYATPNGQPLYAQLGFTEIGRSELLKGRFNFAEPAAEAPAGTSVRPATAEDLQAILSLDHEVFGADRTHLITRLPAFADVLRVAERDGELTGFGALWPNMDTHVIGPLIARDPATAQHLVTALAEATDRPLRTDVEAGHTALLTWLEANGVGSVFTTSLMVRSAPDLPGDANRRFAPLTVAAG